MADNINNADLITTSFSVKDRKKLWIPERISYLEKIDSKTVISWIHRSGHLGYALLKIENSFSGIILERSPMTSQKRACLCDWCLSVYSPSKIASFSFRKTKTLMVSYFLCDDLECEKRIQSPETNTVHNMRETLSKEDRISRYHERAADFWRSHVSQ